MCIKLRVYDDFNDISTLANEMTTKSKRRVKSHVKLMQIFIFYKLQALMHFYVHIPS